MFDVTILKVAGAGITVVAALFYAIFRFRQMRSGEVFYRSTLATQKDEAERRCPHFRDSEIKSAKGVYVRPDCAQVDPANEVEFRKFASVREPIFSAVERYVENESKRHLLILADSGMGKTTFCLNFFDHLKSRRDKPDVALVSLARSNSIRVIANIPSKRTTTLLLDALDEDPKAITSGADR